MKNSKANKPLFLNMNAKQQALFAKRLSLYLRSGIPISRAITYIGEDASSPAIRYVMASLHTTISEGSTVSQGMQKFPRVFSSFSIGFIQAGELSGTLSDSLEELSVFLLKRKAVRTKIYSALSYPAIIFIGTVGISLFLTLVIFPKIIPILRGFKTTLPLPTRLLIWLNALISTKWVLILVVLSVLTVCLILSLRSIHMRTAYERFFLIIPIFSKIYLYYAVTTFCRTLSLQLRAGVAIVPALSLVRTALPGNIYPTTIDKIEERILQGHPLSQALRAYKKLFPALVCQMVSAGEATGTLSENLATLAVQYEEELDELTKNLTVLIEPVLMVCMGLLVGFVALAIITPIYSVTQNLSGLSTG